MSEINVIEKLRQAINSISEYSFRNFVFGFQDGLISTYVLAVGISILIMVNPMLLIFTLIAEIAAGAISMAFGAFISAKIKKQKEENEKNGITPDEKKTLEKWKMENPELYEKLTEDDNKNSICQDPVNN
ncbi:MAG: VIT1/CCC1 transporter family protein, partial [Candidatus Helarchaeales archaeon]